MIEYYDRQGKPMTMEAWVLSFEDNEVKRVAEDEIGGSLVSTVWLGINHQYGNGPPLIFETMVFGGDYDGEQWRYSTEDEARKGHAAAVRVLRKALQS